MEPLGAGTLTEIRKEAAAWLIEMDLEPDRWDRRGFTTWLKSSPRHMEEFLDQSALWVSLHDADPEGIDLLHLFNDAGNVVDWPRSAENAEQRPRENKRRWRFAGLAATALILASAAGLWSLLRDNTIVLTTAIGEQRAVRLVDRSVVTLNTDSQVEIRFTDAVREVRLIHGEALFTVERDVNRPFRVHANGIQVEALGTQFNVRRRTSDTIVSVVEGRVALVGSTDSPPPDGAAVSSQIDTRAGQDWNEAESPETPPSLPYEAGRLAPAGALAVVAAGEQARVSVDGTIEQHAIENVTAATAWRQRQLVFSNTPLADVAAEIARYNVVPRLQIEGKELQARQLNGVFAADDPESLIQFLARDTDLSVTRSGDTVTIRSR